MDSRSDMARSGCSTVRSGGRVRPSLSKTSSRSDGCAATAASHSARASATDSTIAQVAASAGTKRAPSRSHAAPVAVSVEKTANCPGRITSVQFAGRAKKLADQFSAYVVGEKHVRGQATLGENIADLGGVVLGYEAFKKTDQWKKGEKINGLTPDQRYFLGYALSWLGQRRPE